MPMFNQLVTKNTPVKKRRPFFGFSRTSQPILPTRRQYPSPLNFIVTVNITVL